MLRVIQIPVDEPPREAYVEPGLSSMQELVGGYIESVRIGDVDMWVNEEGLLLKLPPNLIASAIARRPICGPAFLARSDGEGETVDVTDSDVNTVLKAFGCSCPEHNGPKRGAS